MPDSRNDISPPFDPAGLDEKTIEAFCRRIDTLEKIIIDLLNRVTIIELNRAPPQ